MFATFVKISFVISYFYLLSVFKRGKLEFFRFFIGSVGFFILGINFVNYLKEPITYIFTQVLSVVGDFTGFFSGYPRYGMFFINKGDTVMSLYMDLECSGIIEMLVYTSLLLFFPVYRIIKKFFLWVLGIVMIFSFNIIRVFGIIVLIYYKGSTYYAFAHSIFGRFIFYILVIALYFCVFTKGQLSKQGTGNFSYDGADDNIFSGKEINEDETD